MKRFDTLAAVAVLAAAVAAAAAPARPQANAAPTFVVKNFPPKPVWLQAEVIHADRRILIVRERANPRVILTFTYAPRIQEAMQKIADRGGYQYGDKVSILHDPGKTVALKVHGKPSKSP